MKRICAMPRKSIRSAFTNAFPQIYLPGGCCKYAATDIAVFMVLLWTYLPLLAPFALQCCTFQQYCKPKHDLLLGNPLHFRGPGSPIDLLPYASAFTGNWQVQKCGQKITSFQNEFAGLRQF